jgi:hypothetical protein
VQSGVSGQNPIHIILLGQALFHILDGCLNLLRGAEGPAFDSIVELHLSCRSPEVHLGFSNRFLFQREALSKFIPWHLFSILTDNERIVSTQQHVFMVIRAVAALSGSRPCIGISGARSKVKMAHA